MVGSFPLTECKFYKAVLCGGGGGDARQSLSIVGWLARARKRGGSQEAGVTG